MLSSHLSHRMLIMTSLWGFLCCDFGSKIHPHSTSYASWLPKYLDIPAFLMQYLPLAWDVENVLFFSYPKGIFSFAGAGTISPVGGVGRGHKSMKIFSLIYQWLHGCYTFSWILWLSKWCLVFHLLYSALLFFPSSKQVPSGARFVCQCMRTAPV